jgi:predicted Na+-dependent transporter
VDDRSADRPVAPVGGIPPSASVVVGAWLERWLLPAVVALAALGIALPGPGRAADRHHGIDIVLAVLVLASALGIPPGSARALRRLAGRLLVIVALASVAVPLLADGLAHLLAPGPLRDGVLAVGVAPAEVASIGLSGLAGGDVAVAAALFGASTLVSVVAAGPILSRLAGSGVSPGHVVVELVLVVALPLVVGLVGRSRPAPDRSRTAPRFAVPAVWRGLPPAVGAWAGPTATVAVLVLVALVGSQVRLVAAYVTVTGVLVALILVSAAGGALLGRLLPPAAARSAVLHVSMRDFAIASGIATAAFGARTTGPLGVYGVLVIGWGTVVATVGARRRSRAAYSPVTPPGG